MIKVKMTVDQAIAHADQWIKVVTVHEGSEGWRVVAKVLADEVRQQRDEIGCETTHLIGVAQALEQQRALKIAESVTNLPVGGSTVDMPTAFHAGYQLACEEITHRLKTEVWDGCLPPKGEL